MKFFRHNFDRIVKYILFTFLLVLIPYQNYYSKNIPDTNVRFAPVKIDLPEPPPIPVNKKISELPKLSTSGVYIVDIPSNIVLYEKNADEKFYPASTTKLMTALVAMDQFNLDDVMTVKTVIAEERKMGLFTGEKLTFESLLYGALVHSGNDAAYTIAENFPGGVEKFVEKMNEKAESLNLVNTHFTNPIGFDDPSHYTTAKELSQIARAAIQNKEIAKIVSIKAITVSDVTFSYYHPLSNVNELLGKISGMSGIKTGYTQTAGEVLVSEVKRNGHDVLFVVLKSQDRFGETESLINWVFDNYSWEPVAQLIPEG